jgi:hypothetical protein
VVEVMTPIVKVLRLTDSDSPSASKIQYHMFEVQERLKKVDLSFMGDAEEADMRQELVAIHRARWDYGFTAVQGAGYMLDPEYWDMEHDDDGEMMDALITMIEKTYYMPVDLTGVCRLLTLSIPANYTLPLLCCHAVMLDHDLLRYTHVVIAVEQKKDPVNVASHAVEVSKRQADRRVAESQYLVYKRKDGLFGRPECQANAQIMLACEWWYIYGAKVKELRKVVVRCLGQVSLLPTTMFLLPPLQET